MDDRLGAALALVVGAALLVVALVRYVAPGYPPPPMEPFTTGVLVAVAGILLAGAGGWAFARPHDDRALGVAVLIGALTLAVAVVQPESLQFGGAFWLGMVAVALVGAGAYLTVRGADGGLNTEPR